MSDNHSLHSFGMGIATLDSHQEIIEVFFPRPLFHPDPAMIDTIADICGYQGGNRDVIVSAAQLQEMAARLANVDAAMAAMLESLSESRQKVVGVFLESDQPPESVAEVYLKLHLLSHRLCQPHSLNLTDAFRLLHNIAWTNKGPIALDDLPARQFQYRINGQSLDVISVDKFPKMTNYVVPRGVRIADTARVRLGAYLGEGTTVMHEGFINFNAGTHGKAMIEGRISAGVVIGEGSDLGGGSSTMGTLSGGGEEIISVGRDCLIGANAGLGIILGDRCVIEAGLYLTAGTKVAVLDQDNEVVDVVKARELSGRSDLLFRRNSQTGAVECRTNQTRVALNESLHANN